MTTHIALLNDALRLADNPALHHAVSAGETVLPVYILDHITPGALKPGGASRWWLHHSLKTLTGDLHELGSPLILRHGAIDRIIEDLLAQTDAAAVHVSRGHAPWSSTLEDQLHAICARAGAQCHRYTSSTLFVPEHIKTAQGNPYTVFTPFWKACRASPPPAAPLPTPEQIRAPATLPASDQLDDWGLLPAHGWDGGFYTSWTPGEAGAKTRLTAFLDTAVETYKAARDKPGVHGTSRLSPHLQFGEISPRTIWHHAHTAMAMNGSLTSGCEKFLSELGWREFSTHLLHHFPSLTEQALRSNFSDFPWQWGGDVPTFLKAWQHGQTGFPIVDAGMRELWQTGYMHNRVRMITASFLVKDLLIHWQEGAAWFWDTLVDADLASNTASWQWVAGCGADAAPYFRIFNPVLQGEKFDPDGRYVRQFVPELDSLPDKWIHKPFEAPTAVLHDAGVILGQTYPEPIINRKVSRARALAAFEQIKK